MFDIIQTSRGQAKVPTAVSGTFLGSRNCKKKTSGLLFEESVQEIPDSPFTQYGTSNRKVHGIKNSIFFGIKNLVSEFVTPKSTSKRSIVIPIDTKKK